MGREEVFEEVAGRGRFQVRIEGLRGAGTFCGEEACGGGEAPGECLNILFRGRNSYQVLVLPMKVAPQRLHGNKHLSLRDSRKGFHRNPRGVFLNEFPGEFYRGFGGDFWGPFSLNKNRRKYPHKNPQQN